jgi:hypothetical protein
MKKMKNRHHHHALMMSHSQFSLVPSSLLWHEMLFRVFLLLVLASLVIQVAVCWTVPLYFDFVLW